MEDTAFVDLHLRTSTLNIGFEWTLPECTDSAIVQTINMTTDPNDPIISWRWNVKSGGTIIDTSDIKEPQFVLYADGTYILELIVTLKTAA